jgi:hypothetical protein
MFNWSLNIKTDLVFIISLGKQTFFLKTSLSGRGNIDFPGY